MTELQRSLEMSEFIKQLDLELKTNLELSRAIPAAATKINAFLCSDLTAVRFNLLNDQLSLGDLWKTIRSDESILDLVMDLTTSMRFLASQHLSQDWEGFLAQVAKAIGVFNGPKVDPQFSTLQDDDELERFATETDMNKYLLSNAWVATLFMIRRLPSYRATLEQFSAQAAVRSSA